MYKGLNLDEPIDFISAFLDSEFEFLKAYYTEADNNIFLAYKNAFKELVSDDVIDYMERSLEARINDDKWFEKGKTNLYNGKLFMRTLLLIRKYHHPIYRRLYRIYVSEPRSYDKNTLEYSQNIFIAKSAGSWKVVAVYQTTLASHQSDKDKYEIDGLFWTHEAGKVFNDFGSLQESVRFEAPLSNKEHLQEYALD